MRAAATFVHGYRLVQLPAMLEHVEEEHGVGDVTNVDVPVRSGAWQAVLRHHEQHAYAGLTQVAQQYVQVQHQQVLIGHRVKVAGQAVDDDEPHAALFDVSTDLLAELVRSQLCRIDL